MCKFIHPTTYFRWGNTPSCRQSSSVPQFCCQFCFFLFQTPIRVFNDCLKVCRYYCNNNEEFMTAKSEETLLEEG